MYRSRVTPPVNFPLNDLPTLDSYRAIEDSDPYKKNRMSSSKVPSYLIQKYVIRFNRKDLESQQSIAYYRMKNRE